MSRAARGALAAAGGLAVTAATVWAAAFRTTSGASVDGAVLGGFLGLGAQDTVHALAARVARLADPPALALITSLIVCVALARRRIALAVAVVAVTAAANASLPTVPETAGISGSVGYSSSGSVGSVKREAPHVTTTRVPSVARSMGAGGRLRVISASRRPGTSTEPPSATVTSRLACADTS
jgi:hypothetical protein